MDNYYYLFFVSLILCSLRNISIVNSQPEVEDESKFTYVEETGKGPKDWGKIDPNWEICGKGKLQSPIDLLDERVQTLSSLGELQKCYQPAHAAVKNRGHDIEVLWKGDAGKITINGTDYKLQQCHWHSPSEHTFNGSAFALELHMVHQSADGKIAVIGIVYEFGNQDPFIYKLFCQIKKSVDGEVDLGILNPAEIEFGSTDYYRYIGSLTVPPCTEGVIWTIVKKPRTVSKEQAKALRDAVHDGFESNARPIQEFGRRPIYVYESSSSV